MIFAPTENELQMLPSLDAEARFDYFITRCMEHEEVWRLCDASGWIMREVDGVKLMPLWPYTALAEQHALPGQSPDAVSLEYFLEYELPDLHEEGIVLELMPDQRPGLRLSAAKLHNILESKMEAEQYFIEG